MMLYLFGPIGIGWGLLQLARFRLNAKPRDRTIKLQTQLRLDRFLYDAIPELSDALDWA